MTVLIAAKQDDKVVLVSDKQWSAYHWSGDLCKQFEKRGIIFASCGTLSAFQPIMNLLTLPPRNEDQIDDDAYVYSVVDSIRNFMINRLDNKKLESIEASFILISKMGIYQISSDFAVTKYDEVAVDGSGKDVALGAFYALEGYVEDIEDRCVKAVQVAIDNTLFCGKGIDTKVIELNKPTKEGK